MNEKDYDVIIIGAGPTGIFTALELIKKDAELNILILEKGNDLDKMAAISNIFSKFLGFFSISFSIG